MPVILKRARKMMTNHAIKIVDDIVSEADRGAYIRLAASILDLSLVVPSDDEFYQFEVFIMFRYTVMGCVFKTLKRLRKLTEKYASNYIRLLLLTTP
jgi:hypothetical protein